MDVWTGVRDTVSRSPVPCISLAGLGCFAIRPGPLMTLVQKPRKGQLNTEQFQEENG